MRRWAVLLIGVLFIVTITGAGRASAAGGTYRVIAGGDQNWTPGSGSIDQTSTDAVRVTGTLTGDPQGHSVGTTDYEVAAGPGIVRARVHGGFQIPSGSAYPYDPSVQGVSSTELTVSGPAGEITTSLNVHVDGFLATPQCGSGTTCGAIGVEIHAGSGVGSEFNSLGDINKNQLGLSFDAVPGGYHVHGDVTTAAMVLPVNAPVPVTLNMSLGGRFSGGPATSTFDGNFDDPVALSQVSFAPSGPVLNNIPAGYTVSGPAVVNNHWADPFATPPPPSDTTAPAVTGTPDRPANVFGWYSGPVTIDWQATDASGQASDPPDTLVTGEGRDMRIMSSPSCDPSNNCASGDVTLSIDRTPPTLTCSDLNPVFPVSRNSLAFVFIDVNDQLSGGGGARALGAGVDISSPGQKTVEIAGEDFAGNEALVTCAYTVVDSTAPAVTGTPDRPANVFGWYSGPVTIDWQATDASGQASDPPDTLVTGEGRDMLIMSSPSCDPSNNCASGDVTLSIDRTPPTLTCSDPNPVFPVSRNSLAFVFIDVNDQLSGGGGARALGAGVDISSPGQKTVEIAGEDFAGNEALVTCAYTVLLSDSTPPVLTVPAGMAVDATSPAGAQVSFVVTAVDGVDPSPVVLCVPRSGSTFAAGSTTVTCTAVDASGNAASRSFTITVAGANAQILRLMVKTRDFLDLPPLRLTLQATLLTAANAQAAGRQVLACTALDLYVAEVWLSPARAFSPAERAALIGDAIRIRAVVGCA